MDAEERLIGYCVSTLIVLFLIWSISGFPDLDSEDLFLVCFFWLVVTFFVVALSQVAASGLVRNGFSRMVLTVVGATLFTFILTVVLSSQTGDAFERAYALGKSAAQAVGLATLIGGIVTELFGAWRSRVPTPKIGVRTN